MKDLLLNLIKDDLVYARLLNGLADLGFDTTDYYLNLNDTVFHLAGFTRECITEELREWYFGRLERAHLLTVPPRSCAAFDTMAEGIFRELEWRKSQQ